MAMKNEKYDKNEKNGVEFYKTLHRARHRGTKEPFKFTKLI